MPTPKLAVIMPATERRSERRGRHPATLASLDAFAIDGELIVVDDGSSDRTGQCIREAMARDPRVRMVRHETPQGVGAAFWDGVAAARGEFVTMMPGDNENDPRETLRYASLLEHVDIVLPFVFNKSVRSRSRNSSQPPIGPSSTRPSAWP